MVKRLLKEEIYNIMDLIDKTNKLFLESYDLMKLEESLGVSDVVIQTTDDLYKTIVNKIKWKNSIEIYNGLYKLSFPIEIMLEGSKISSTITFYNLTSNEVYKHLECDGKLSLIDDSCYSTSRGKKLNFLFLNYIIYSNKIDKTKLYETIFHEIEHLFQQIMANKTFNKNDLYNLVKRNYNSNNGLTRAIARILYLSFDEEIESFTNGLYGFLVSSNSGPNMTETIKESDLYKKIYEAEELMKLIRGNKDNENLLNSLSIFGINYNKLDNVHKQTLDKIKRKVSKIMIRYRNKLYIEGMRGI